MKPLYDAAGSIVDYEPLYHIEIDEADDSPTEVYLMSTVPIQSQAGTEHHYFPIFHGGTI